MDSQQSCRPVLIILDQVDWHRIDSEGNPSYRSCDFCYESATDDISQGKYMEDFRGFYLLPDGCCVCEHCIPNVIES